MKTKVPRLYLHVWFCLFSFSSSSMESVSRMYLADLWKSSTRDEVFRVEGHVSVVCKVVLQFDSRMSFTARARLVDISCISLF